VPGPACTANIEWGGMMRTKGHTVKVLVALLLLNGMTIGPASAAVKWIDLALQGGGIVRAALGIVDNSGRPAVIFNHGTGVRHLGHAGALNNDNMDVTKYVEALNARGFTAIAPIRKHLSDTAYRERGETVGSSEDWTAVIEEGLRVSAAARTFLIKRAGADPSRIAIMGFSEGGNVTLWSAIRQRGYRAVVLMSPATIRATPVYGLRQAARKSNLSSIDAPVYLAVGRDDHRSIRRVVERRLIPNLQKLDKNLVYRTDYPGEHEWFYQVRDELMNDVIPFLEKHLK
jgi:predicted esterase